MGRNRGAVPQIAMCSAPAGGRLQRRVDFDRSSPTRRRAARHRDGQSLGPQEPKRQTSRCAVPLLHGRVRSTRRSGLIGSAIIGTGIPRHAPIVSAGLPLLRRPLCPRKRPVIDFGHCVQEDEAEPFDGSREIAQDAVARVMPSGARITSVTASITLSPTRSRANTTLSHRISAHCMTLVLTELASGCRIA
ncbi:hypothetical protein AWB77_04573 [Caballeronia fortuita]|uniref:Uncharacterized protein n=1 Tax=Caballeronia fortuita TaxID=1777138 RepID=A0A158CUU2_9BURK|nr:hypothetical protein AWB77_04573 [Caballeronia fortuita]